MLKTLQFHFLDLEGRILVDLLPIVRRDYKLSNYKLKTVGTYFLGETKDPINNLNETIKNTSEVIKRLPELPEIMDKANQALTFLASGQIPQNSNSFTALNDKKSEMIAFRNQSIIGLLALVIVGLLVF